MRHLSRERRVRQGAAMLAAAAVFALAFVALDLAFWWVPLGVGLVYLAAAAASGRDGSYWATAVTVSGWGLSVAWLNVADPDVIAPAAQVFGIGVGALAGAALARQGFAVDLLGVAAAAAGVGLLFMLERQAGWLVDWETYAVLLGAIGLINLALAPGSPRDARPSPG
ncbi:MAG: hypothetical protein H0U32_03830 [Thermoleophilaceae bacterium]|nr:hypothetical protein [Thermoleophilaceae bacterium]